MSTIFLNIFTENYRYYRYVGCSDPHPNVSVENAIFDPAEDTFVQINSKFVWKPLTMIELDSFLGCHWYIGGMCDGHCKLYGARIQVIFDCETIRRT